MQRSRRLHIGASKVHKWLSLMIGAQLLIWFASGALMSFLPIDKVRGEHLVDRTAFAALPLGTVTISSDRLVAHAGAPIESITWRMLERQPVAEVRTKEGILLFNATGKKMAPVDAPTATRIARTAWKGANKPVSSAALVTAENAEYKEALPAWRIAFDDADRTNVFVSASTGRIVAVRTGTWRLYDFFWGLHIMDWQNHEDFNNWWLRAFAVGALVLGFAGSVLLVMRWPLRGRRRPA